MNELKHIRAAVWMLLLLAVLAGCSANAVNTLPISSELAEFVGDAPQMVKEAYAYAVANPHELKKYPCYCGCGNMGHTSNLSCYIKEIAADGRIAFDNHAPGCGICVDITGDVMRLKAVGKSSPEIRTYIDAQYSPFGPGTDTEFPVD